MKRKKIILYGVAAFLVISGITALPTENVIGGVGCLVIAAICVFFGKREKVSKQENTSSNAESSNRAVTASPKEIEIKPQESTEPREEYEFYKFKVAGVTFKNDDKTDRQRILRAIRFKDEPYNKEIELGLQEQEFNGEVAYGVYVNDKQIGYVPKEKVGYIKERFNNIEGITHISVYGGGRAESGEPISYGAEITLKIRG